MSSFVDGIQMMYATYSVKKTKITIASAIRKQSA